tara:strand:- start:661 stop:789 length:129 start_codon:yes stop_codon:yes gene_type:complete
VGIRKPGWWFGLALSEGKAGDQNHQLNYLKLILKFERVFVKS